MIPSGVSRLFCILFNCGFSDHIFASTASFDSNTVMIGLYLKWARLILSKI
jgi:hypothetical protein